MANEKNLKKFKKGDVSHEEAVRRGSLGGKARAKKIKEQIHKTNIKVITLHLKMLH